MAGSALDFWEHFVDSPPLFLAVGMALGAGVAKSFKSIGDTLREQDNREIARWLKIRNVEASLVAEHAANLPSTFVGLFDHVFGERHLSFRCFFRCCLISLAIYAISVAVLQSIAFQWIGAPNWKFSLAMTAGSVPIAYVSLLETRVVLGMMARSSGPLGWATLIVADFLLTYTCAALKLLIWDSLPNAMLVLTAQDIPWYDFAHWEMLPDLYVERVSEALRDPWTVLVPTLLIPSERIPFPFYNPALSPTIPGYVSAFFTSIFLWLYLGSVMLLGAARRADIGLQWFTVHFDIDKKPLQAIGLVAGGLVAVGYWLIAGLFRLTGGAVTP